MCQAPAQGVFYLLGDRIAGTSKHGNKKWTKAARKHEQCIHWNKYAKCKNMVRLQAVLDAYNVREMNGEKYVENHHKFIDEELASWYDLWGSWEFMDEPVMDPAFTTAENEELAELKSEVTDILTTSYDAFIMGQRPVSEWTQVQDQIRESAERICEIYNTAAAR